MHLRVFCLGIAAAALFALVGCTDDGARPANEPEVSPPRIDSVVPDSAEAGAPVRITGSAFGGERGSSRVRFGPLDALPDFWSETRIDVAVPDSAATGSIRVVVDGVESNPYFFVVLSGPPPSILLETVIPGRTIVADTVWIRGFGFGTQRGDGAVAFAGSAGGRIEAEIVSWADTEVSALVPAGAGDGDLRIRKGGTESDGVPFEVAPRAVGYRSDLVGLFQATGCLGCHGGSAGLFLQSPAAAIAGGDRGPGVVPRRSAESILVQKIGPSPPFGDRMPLGCETVSGCLQDEEVLLVSDWIDQGARDN